MVHEKLVRAAADLLATVVTQTEPLNCRGASIVVFFARATNAIQVSAQAVEVRKRGGAWVTGAPPQWIILDTNTGITGGALDAGGRILVVRPSVAAAVGHAWDEVRLALTGDGASTITGLEVWGETHFPGVLSQA